MSRNRCAERCSVAKGVMRTSTSLFLGLMLVPGLALGGTDDAAAALTAPLVRDHTVIVPDLRGMGLSAHPDVGYTKKNQAVDIAGVLDALKIEKADLVTHD